MAISQPVRTCLSYPEADSLVEYLRGRGYGCEVAPAKAVSPGSHDAACVVSYPRMASEAVAEWQRIVSSVS